MCFCFFVVWSQAYLPPQNPLLPLKKWVRGKQVGGGAYIPCEWKLTLMNDHSTIEETVALIQGALKEVDEEGVMEVEAFVKIFST